MGWNALEWLNENMHRNYPIVDDAVVRSITGDTLPSSLLVDFSLLIPPLDDADASDRFYISEVNQTGAFVQIALSYYMPSGASFVVARTQNISTDVQSGDPVEARTFSLIAANSIPDAYSQMRDLTGQVIIGTCQDIIGKGSFSLRYENATILSTLIMQSIAGIQHVTVVASDETQSTFSGDFVIRAGDGIGLSVTQEYNSEAGEYMDVLSISRTTTDAENNAEFKSVEDILRRISEEYGNPIKSINGATPDSGGAFVIQSGDCTSITTTDNGIAISNPCAKPCCSETSTSDTQMALQLLEEARTRLLGYFESVSTNINAIQARLSSLIASRR